MNAVHIDKEFGGRPATANGKGLFMCNVNLAIFRLPPLFMIESVISVNFFPILHA